MGKETIKPIERRIPPDEFYTVKQVDSINSEVTKLEKRKEWLVKHKEIIDLLEPFEVEGESLADWEDLVSAIYDYMKVVESN